MSRSDALVNQSLTLGFRHLNGAQGLVNAEEIVSVKIYDPQGNLMGTLAGSSVQNPEAGVYQVTAPGNWFPAPGQYHDVWLVRSTSTSSPRNFSFDIQVVLFQNSQPPDFATVLTCNLASLDACMLKKFFLWPVWTVLSNGYYLSDSILQYHIDTSITEVQRLLGIPLRRVRVRTRPFADETPNLVKGVDYEEDGFLQDWNAIDSEQWSTIRLPVTGVYRVVGVRGVFNGKTVYRIPNEWVDRNHLRMGFIRIRPTTAGTLQNLVDSSGRFLDVTLLEAIGNNFVPGFWALDYDYGAADDRIEKEICSVIMKKAAIMTLDQLGQAIGRGLTSRSTSVDGLSSSLGFVASSERTIFGALVNRYQEETSDEKLMDMRRFYKGPSAFII